MNKQVTTDLQRVFMFTNSDQQQYWNQLQFLRQRALHHVIRGMQVPGLLDANFAALHMLELSKAGREPALLIADVAMADFVVRHPRL